MASPNRSWKNNGRVLEWGICRSSERIRRYIHQDGWSVSLNSYQSSNKFYSNGPSRGHPGHKMNVDTMLEKWEYNKNKLIVTTMRVYGSLWKTRSILCRKNVWRRQRRNRQCNQEPQWVVSDSVSWGSPQDPDHSSLESATHKSENDSVDRKRALRVHERKKSRRCR